MAASCSRGLPDPGLATGRASPGLPPARSPWRLQAGDAQDRGDRRVELFDAGFEVEHASAVRSGMRRRRAGGNDLRRRLDQPAARFAGHVLERIEEVPQLAELQRADLEVAAAERDRFAHRVYSLTLNVPIAPVGSANALKSNSWIS